MTVISSASAITWLLVTTMPVASMTKPEPSELTRRGPRSRFCGSFWPRRLKKSLNSSSSCGSLGNCGIGVLRASTFCEVEILTTASITRSATSEMPSGPRANDDVESAGKTIAAAATVARAGRRTCRANWARVPSMDVTAPELVDARHCSRPGMDARATSTCRIRLGIGAESGPGGGCAGLAVSSAHEPDQHDTEHGRDDSRDPQRRFRAFQRARRQPFGDAGKGGEQQSLDHKHETDRNDELGHLCLTGLAIVTSRLLPILPACLRTACPRGARFPARRRLRAVCRTDRRSSGRTPNRA